MAQTDDEPKWMRRIKTEGPVPLLKPDHCPNGWATPPGEKFMVRGPDYFATKVKIPAGDFLLQPLGFDWIKGHSKIGNLLKDRNYRIRKVLDEEFRNDENKPFIWAFNLQVPSKENYSAIAYFVSTKPFPENSLVDQFMKGDDTFKDSRLKLIANIVKGPWIVRKAVGEQAICIIGRALNCKYCVGKNFIEVDIDIGSSVVASAIVHLAFGYVTTLTVDLAFLIESQTDSELPEKLLGGFRFSELQPDSALMYEASSFESTPTSTPRLGMRLWKTLGQGFSQLLHQSAPESDLDPRVNGIVEKDADVGDNGGNKDMKCALEKDDVVDDNNTESSKIPAANDDVNNNDTENTQHTAVSDDVHNNDTEVTKHPAANVDVDNNDTENTKHTAAINDVDNKDSKPPAVDDDVDNNDTENTKHPAANVAVENNDTEVTKHPVANDDVDNNENTKHSAASGDVDKSGTEETKHPAANVDVDNNETENGKHTAVSDDVENSCTEDMKHPAANDDVDNNDTEDTKHTST